MAKIIREPSSAAKESYDLIIIGGGIYGAMLSLEASRRGLRSLLLERDDFGEHTSFNSLRIVHGGLRYLQSLDLDRFGDSVGERRWFLRTFPELVKPLPCLMPLYGQGLRRPSILRIGLLVNETLSRNRNLGVRSDRHLAPGQVIDATKTREIFSSVDTEGLQGGAVWYDAFVPDSQRLLMEILRWSCEYGAITLNYVEACQLLQTEEVVAGVMAIDRISGESHEYKARIVVNASGPWCRDLAARFDRDEPTLFKSLLVWNVLFDRKPLSDHALAVTPKKPGGQTYFLVPWKGLLFAGTGQAPWLIDEKIPMPLTEQMEKFLDDLNLAVPTLEVSQDNILRVFPGLQPATGVGTNALATREIIFNHAKHGGPRGFYSISGVKFTTASLVARKTLDRVFHKSKGRKELAQTSFDHSQHAMHGGGIFDYQWYTKADDSKWKDNLRSLVEEEAVQHLDDLIFRRTTLWENPVRALEIAPIVCTLFGWNDSQCREEIARLKKKLIVK